MRTGLFFLALFCLASCAATEPRPPGVPRSVAFAVTPLYPRSYEIVAGSQRRISPEILREAWRQKALMVAAGRRFKTNQLVVHDTETVPYGGWPLGGRTVTGTITLLDSR